MVNVHTVRQTGFNKSKAVAQGKGELTEGFAPNSAIGFQSSINRLDKRMLRAGAKVNLALFCDHFDLDEINDRIEISYDTTDAGRGSAAEIANSRWAVTWLDRRAGSNF